MMTSDDDDDDDDNDDDDDDNDDDSDDDDDDCCCKRVSKLAQLFAVSRTVKNAWNPGNTNVWKPWRDF